MCSGRIGLEFVLRAFSNGIDGVFVGGCRLNECNYITQGNYHALNMVLLGKKILEHIGINPEEYDKFFTRDEVDKLINEAPSYYIDPEKCQACMICARRCPAEAIISAKGEVHIINQEECIKCGTCFDVCPPKFKAVTKIVGAPVPPPLPEDQRSIIRKGKGQEVA